MVAYAGVAVEGNCTLLVLASCPRYVTYHTGGKSVVENVVVDGIAVTAIDMRVRMGGLQERHQRLVWRGWEQGNAGGD